MRELFKIGPRHSQDEPTLFHPYHLQSHNHTHGIIPGTVYPPTHNIDLHHSSLLGDLGEGIGSTLSILEGSDTSDPFPSLLYSTTNTTCEPHTHPTPTHATSKITLLPSSPSTPLPSLTLPMFTQQLSTQTPQCHNLWYDAHTWRPWITTVQSQQAT